MPTIKTITINKYDYMLTKPGTDFTDVKPVISSFTEFDKEGHTLTEISYLGDGSIEQQCEYKYNEKGESISEILINDEGFVDEKKSLEYNDKGQLVKEFLFYQDESFDTSEFIYDADGNLLEKVTKDHDGIPESRKEYKYENKHLISEAAFDGEGNIITEVNYVYDENGNETEIKQYVAEDEKRIRSEFAYDDHSRKKEAYAYNTKDELVAKNLYKLDDKGQVIEIVEEDQFSKSNTVIEYDEKGNMVSQLESNEAGELNQRILRKFDENDNLIEVAVTIDKHGVGLNQNYVLHYSYEYFD